MKIFQPQVMSEIGQRPNQEDAVFPLAGISTSNDRLFIVCDGMGGHEAGEVASDSVSKSFGDFMKNANPDTFSVEDLRLALTYAYDQLDNLDKDPNNARKMGTTLTFLYLGNNRAFIAHVGDSRVYQLRQDVNGVTTIVHKTEDHSLVNELVRAKIITPEEAKTHPRRNVITRALQPNTQERCKATVWETNNVKAGDYFFLCSDGVLESIDDDTLTSIIGTDASDEDKLNSIKELCAQNSKDNNSAYLIHIEEGYMVADTNGIIAKESNIAPNPSKNPPAKPATVATTQPVAATPRQVPSNQATAPVVTSHKANNQQAPHPHPNNPIHQTSPTGGGKVKERPFSSGILAGLAVAALILLGGGGYLAYTHFSSEDKENTPERQETETTDKSQPETETKTKTGTGTETSSPNEKTEKTEKTTTEKNKTVTKKPTVVPKPSTPTQQQTQQRQQQSQNQQQLLPEKKEKAEDKPATKPGKEKGIVSKLEEIGGAGTNDKTTGNGNDSEDKEDKKNKSTVREWLN